MVLGDRCPHATGEMDPFPTRENQLRVDEGLTGRPAAVSPRLSVGASPRLCAGHGVF